MTGEYEQALTWLFSRTRAGAARSPARMARLLAELNLAIPPRVAHVVGTNGKGTVSAMIATGIAPMPKIVHVDMPKALPCDSARPTTR